MAKHGVQSWSAEKHGSDQAARDRIREDRLPRLAMDSAGRQVLWDRPQEGCCIAGMPASRKESKVTKKTLTTDELTRYVGLRIKDHRAADRYWARCMGRDAAMDDETAEKLKEFLKTRLSAGDHAQACDMLEGGVEAQDDLPESAAGEPLPKKTPAEDSADFFKRYPGAAKIRVDTTGLQPPPRQAKPRVALDSATDVESFEKRFPDAKRIKVLG